MSETRMQPKYVDGMSIHPGFIGYKFEEDAAKKFKEMLKGAMPTARGAGWVYGDEDEDGGATARMRLVRLITVYINLRSCLRFNSEAPRKVISNSSIKKIHALLDRFAVNGSYNIHDIREVFSVLRGEFYICLKAPSVAGLTQLFSN